MRLLAGLLAVTAGLSINAQVQATALSEMRQLLTQAPRVCGTFTQKKFLKALTRPLESRGRVLFVAGQGVLWQVTDPFPARALVRADALIRWNEDGKPIRTGFGQTPRFRALSDVFLAVFAGTTGRLPEAFDVGVRIDASKWRLDLKPRDPAFAKQISRIHVAGAQFVEKLELVESRGDRTEIRFEGLTGKGCRLSAAEKQYFAR